MTALMDYIIERMSLSHAFANPEMSSEDYTTISAYHMETIHDGHLDFKEIDLKIVDGMDQSNSYILAAFLSIAICVLLIMMIMYTFCHKEWPSLEEAGKYLRSDAYEFRPITYGVLDLEHESTFVGVTIPLLNDVSDI